MKTANTPAPDVRPWFVENSQGNTMDRALRQHLAAQRSPAQRLVSTGAQKANSCYQLPNKKTMSFEPPTHVPGEDWVFVLDDAARNYPPPGTQP